MSDATTPAPLPAPEQGSRATPHASPPAAPYGEWRRRRRGFLLPMILIALGAFFFLGNLGYLPPVSWRAFLSLWPLLLVLGGVEILVARRQPLLAAALEVAVVAGGIALVAVQPYGFLAPAAATGGNSFSVPRGTSHTLSLRVEGAAGTYTIAGGGADLVDARASGGHITVRDERRGDAADVLVRPTSLGGNVFAFPGAAPVSVDVRVAGDVPTSLRVSGGAGDFTVDLTGIQVRDARVDTGASRLDLTLPKPSGDVPVRISAGAASLTIVVPDGVEAAITSQGGLLSTTTLNPRLGAGTSASLARSATTLETPGYAAAKDRVTVMVSAGASSVTIR